MRFTCESFFGLMMGLFTATHGWAVTTPFTEAFDTNTANWKNSASLDLTHVASGGADGGGYVATNTSFVNTFMNSVILFRGHDMFNSSNDALVGNWLAADVRRLVAYVRHDVPEPLAFFLRIATPFNFPAVIFDAPLLVPAGVWTPLEFQISPTNPLLTVEGPPNNYVTTLSNVGNVQFGIVVPAGKVGDPTTYTFDLDQVSIAVPEPSSMGSLLLAVAAVGGIRRTRIRRN